MKNDGYASPHVDKPFSCLNDGTIECEIVNFDNNPSTIFLENEIPHDLFSTHNFHLIEPVSNETTTDESV